MIVQLIVSLGTDAAAMRHAWKSPGVVFHTPIDGESYPPYKQHQRMWQSLRLSDADWFTRCDADTYLNRTLLHAYLNKLDSTVPHYVGQIGWGRASDKRLRVPPFVMGGGCETVNAAALRKINLPTCRRLSVLVLGPYAENAQHYHSDVELGRCFAAYDIRPTEPPLQRVFHYAQNKRTGQAKSIPICNLGRVTGTTLVAHPVKNPAIMMALQRSALTVPSCDCASSPVIQYQATSCGKGRQYQPGDPCGIRKPECVYPVSRPPLPVFYNPTIYIIGWNAHKRINDVPTFLGTRRPHIMIPLKTNSSDTLLTPGEHSLMLTFDYILKHAIRANQGPFVILEDDFIVHQDAHKRWQGQTDCVRNTLKAGGVLLLGHTTWYKDAWEQNTSHLPDSCFNINIHNSGAFAVIYTIEAARTIHQWITFTQGGLSPYDHVYRYLTAVNTPVRAAWPPLMVADVSHISTVNPSVPEKHNVTLRHALHRWGPRREFLN